MNDVSMDQKLEDKIAVKESRSYVYNQRKNQEKFHRDQRKESGKRRRNDTLYRASQPQTKQSKLVKKHNKNELKYLLKSVRDVNTKHNEINNNFEMMILDKYELQNDCLNSMQNYQSNFKEWNYNKEHQLYTASLLDQKYKDKLGKEKIKVEQQNLFNLHKRKFKSSLLQICPNYQQGTKIEVIKPKSTGLIGFFKRSPGFNKEKTESRFNSFYFNSIVGVKTKIHVFPEAFNDEKEKEKKKCINENENSKDYACDNCDTNMIIDSKIGVLCCPGCGITKMGGIGIGLKQTFAESQASTRSAAPYDRLAHVSSIIFFYFLTRTLKTSSISIIVALIKCNPFQSF